MPAHLNDLPPAARERARALIDAAPARPRPSRALLAGGSTLMCGVCGERVENASEYRLTKHSATHPDARSIRYEMVVDG